MKGSSLEGEDTPLRSSCDPCRAQKLRCTRSSETNPTAPCQRCSRAKEPKSCVFSRRMRTGRHMKKAEPSDVQARKPRREKETETLNDFPGLITFPLSTNSTPSECSAQQQSPQATEGWNPDNTEPVALAPVDTLTDYWREHEKAALDKSFQLSLDFHFEVDASSIPQMEVPSPSEPGNSLSPNLNAFLDIQDFQFPPHTINSNQGAMNLNVPDISSTERPGPPVDFTGLLAKMFQYQSQLSRLHNCELDDYPIGDSLFLSQWFCAILSDHRHGVSQQDSYHLHTPSILLILSCYMTMRHIYSFIFGYLHDHLSQLQEIRPTHELGRSSHLMLSVDMHTYQGLNLGQLRSTCAFAAHDSVTRAKNAVLLLASSLRSAEEAIGLAPDVRVLSTSRSDAPIEGDSSTSVVESEGKLLFEDAGIMEIGGGMLYKTLREEARELRAKVEDVNTLLNGLLASSW